LDADHAALQTAWKDLLERRGWQVQAEVTYSRYGERGSIDLLALHTATGILLVIEIKTALLDVQAVLATLDAKTRLASHVAAGLGWRPTSTVPMIVLAGGTTTRRRVQQYASLFSGFGMRGHAARAWLREFVSRHGS
jgi:Holliday junction resolvase-like predicted endonuclease